MRIPLPDNSIDVVITCHAIEPNRKNMKNIIKELYRVSNMGLCLMEPHYEIGNVQQKKRMDYFKYVKGIPKFLKKEKYDYKIVKKKFHINPNNPSSMVSFFDMTHAVTLQAFVIFRIELASGPLCPSTVKT